MQALCLRFQSAKLISFCGDLFIPHLCCILHVLLVRKKEEGVRQTAVVCPCT